MPIAIPTVSAGSATAIVFAESSSSESSAGGGERRIPASRRFRRRSCQR